VTRHNKKRNVGLIYELLIRRLSKAIVENDTKKTKLVQGILHNRFQQGTELYKEFRLFNAIVKTSDVSDSIAYRIIDEAKRAATDHDPVALDREKSLLIKDINHKINEQNFYDVKIENYTALASMQQLLNSWRDESISDIHECAKHEKTVHSWLVRESAEKPLESHKTQSVNDLTFKVMQEKFERKYSNDLSNNQAKMLRLYCEGKQDELRSVMSTTIKETNEQINAYSKKGKDRFLLEKVKSVNELMSTHDFACDAVGVAKVLTLEQLATQLKEITDV